MTVGQDGCGRLAHLLSPHLLSPGHPGYGEILANSPITSVMTLCLTIFICSVLLDYYVCDNTHCSNYNISFSRMLTGMV